MSADPFGISALTDLLKQAVVPHSPSELEKTLTAMVASRLEQRPVQTSAPTPALKTQDFQHIVNAKLDSLMATIDLHVNEAVAQANAVAAVPSAAEIEAMVEKIFKKMVQARVTHIMGVKPPDPPVPPDTGQVAQSSTQAAPLAERTKADWIDTMSGHFTVLNGIISEENPLREDFNTKCKAYNTASDAGNTPQDELEALKTEVRKASNLMITTTSKQIAERVGLITNLVNEAKTRGWWVKGADGVKDNFDTMKASMTPITPKLLIPACNRGYVAGVDTYEH